MISYKNLLVTSLFMGLLSSFAWGQSIVEPSPDLVVFKNIPYVTGGEYRQQLDLYLPKDYARAERPYPTILVVHGGGWARGSKDEYVFLANWLVPHGYIVAITNYRLIDAAYFPAQLQDCKSAVRWLRAHAEKYNIDKRHIGTWGASAGGHLVALMGSTAGMKEFDVGEHLEQSSDIQAVCDLFGPTFFALPDPGTTNASGSSSRRRLIAPDVPDQREAWLKASPMNYVKKDVAPIIIVHGDEDELVSYQQSVIYDKALREAGADCQFITIKGGKHGGEEFMQPQVLKPIEDFFAKHLKSK